MGLGLNWSILNNFAQTALKGVGVKLYGGTSGTVGIKAPAVAGAVDYTLPGASPLADESAAKCTTAGVIRWATPRVWQTSARHVGVKNELTSLATTNGTDLSATFRNGWTCPTPLMGFRLVFTNFVNAAAGANAYTIGSIVWYTSVVTVQRITFNGSASVVVQPGGVVVSDPVSCMFPAGSAVNFMIYVSVTTGQTFPLNWLHNVGADTNNLVSGGGSGADVTTSGSIGTTSATKAGFGPSAIIGLCSQSTPVLCGIGDSKMAGAGETSPNSLLGGWYRAALASGLPWLRIGQGGKKMQDWIDPRTWTNVTPILTQAGVSDYFINLGVNDIIAGRTLAQLQGDAITVWKFLAGLGGRVHQTTCEPGTTSTDSYATAANQTVKANFEASGSVWRNWNDWLLDGAPILSGVAVATGSNAAGTIRMGAPGHYLTSVDDILPTMQDASNPGKWKSPGYTTDGTHETTAAHILNQPVYAAKMASLTAP